MYIRWRLNKCLIKNIVSFWYLAQIYSYSVQNPIQIRDLAWLKFYAYSSSLDRCEWGHIIGPYLGITPIWTEIWFVLDLKHLKSTDAQVLSVIFSKLLAGGYRVYYSISVMHIYSWQRSIIESFYHFTSLFR